MKKFLSLVVALTLVASTVFVACQREERQYPSRPVTAIVPFAPGGGSDTLVRAVMRSLQLPNNQSMVAVNVEGAGGFIGAMRAFNSAADGYNIMTHNTLDLIAYYLTGQDTIPIWSQSTIIALLVTDYNVLSTNRIFADANGIRTIEDMVAWVRANPGQRLNLGTSGGSLGDNMIASVTIARALGIEDSINFVLYDSGATARTASLQNEIQLSVNTASELPGVVASGDNIPLLVVNNARIASLPDVPTTLEAGIDFTLTKPRGFFGPRGMEPAHVEVLQEALRAVSNDPEFRATMATLGFDVQFVDGATARTMTNEWFAIMQAFADEVR